METLAGVLLYIIGVTCSYILFKKWWVCNSDEWLVRDRRFIIIISILFSWIALLTALIITLMDIKGKDSNKKANW